MTHPLMRDLIEKHNRLIEAQQRVIDLELKVLDLTSRLRFTITPTEALRLWVERGEARDRGDFGRADEIRTRLHYDGVQLPKDPPPKKTEGSR